MVTAEDALPGRAQRIFEVPREHAVLGTPLEGPWPEGTEVLYVAMGCYWGAERMFWQVPGVVTTAVGFQGGFTENPTYEESTTGRTGHAETVLIAYDPTRVSPEQLLKVFWENHDPTQGFRQGNDRGTEYRSAIHTTTDVQLKAAHTTRDTFQRELDRHGHGSITTEVRPVSEAGPFWYAEDYHQQYLAKVPNGYCNHGPNGLTCQIGLVGTGD
ncbi:peptide-methionine (S)-S-oxide reductase MsrA [Kineococcus sp. R8]|uniref:peptide-methionine (S)-S-oxide reductase MsrA n=1 Tax=Kineococcus siccus TaxID=2696567 RepID=UPI00141372BE|nr:peptide-methionine (S)-S-oxide reductase MsrA [Kineococcus siccus]NAZ81752.1 peptide-methionine (S)-S-oxide reductase MsrA [Kineococcus siccus]